MKINLTVEPKYAKDPDKGQSITGTIELELQEWERLGLLLVAGAQQGRPQVQASVALDLARQIVGKVVK